MPVINQDLPGRSNDLARNAPSKYLRPRGAVDARSDLATSAFALEFGVLVILVWHACGTSSSSAVRPVREKGR